MAKRNLLEQLNHDFCEGNGIPFDDGLDDYEFREDEISEQDDNWDEEDEDNNEDDEYCPFCGSCNTYFDDFDDILRCNDCESWWIDNSDDEDYDSDNESYYDDVDDNEDICPFCGSSNLDEEDDIIACNNCDSRRNNECEEDSLYEEEYTSEQIAKRSLLEQLNHDFCEDNNIPYYDDLGDYEFREEETSEQEDNWDEENENSDEEEKIPLYKTKGKPGKNYHGVDYEEREFEATDGTIGKGTFPNYDDLCIIEYTLDVYYGSPEFWDSRKDGNVEQMKAATRMLKEELDSDPSLNDEWYHFTDKQLEDIRAEKEKIDGYVWHHNENGLVMQLIPEEYHQFGKHQHTGGMATNNSEWRKKNRIK